MSRLLFLLPFLLVACTPLSAQEDTWPPQVVGFNGSASWDNSDLVISIAWGVYKPNIPYRPHISIRDRILDIYGDDLATAEDENQLLTFDLADHHQIVAMNQAGCSIRVYSGYRIVLRTPSCLKGFGSWSDFFQEGWAYTATVQFTAGHPNYPKTVVRSDPLSIVVPTKPAPTPRPTPLPTPTLGPTPTQWTPRTPTPTPTPEPALPCEPTSPSLPQTLDSLFSDVGNIYGVWYLDEGSQQWQVYERFRQPNQDAPVRTLTHMEPGKVYLVYGTEGTTFKGHVFSCDEDYCWKTVVW